MDYRLIRSKRKTISLRITADGTLEVRCPSRMPRYQVDALIESRRDWIEKQLSRLPPAQPRLTAEELSALYREARTDLQERVACYAPLMGVTWGKITIRSQKTRWGSCSSRGNLNFNCLLMLAPPRVRDYVVVHELCHRKEMNHSARFWHLVEEILPDWRQSRQWLRENGTALMGRLPE